jgi:hypothetical protein
MGEGTMLITMARRMRSSVPPPFPPIGFLILGVLSLTAAAVLAVRAITVEATGERIWSAVLFGGMGMFWLAAYRASHRGHRIR